MLHPRKVRGDICRAIHPARPFSVFHCHLAAGRFIDPSGSGKTGTAVETVGFDQIVEKATDIVDGKIKGRVIVEIA
ncbi:hypothetical protein [Aliamphritea spongicola]